MEHMYCLVLTLLSLSALILEGKWVGEGGGTADMGTLLLHTLNLKLKLRWRIPSKVLPTYQYIHCVCKIPIKMTKIVKFTKMQRLKSIFTHYFEEHRWSESRPAAARVIEPTWDTECQARRP